MRDLTCGVYISWAERCIAVLGRWVTLSQTLLKAIVSFENIVWNAAVARGAPEGGRASQRPGAPSRKTWLLLRGCSQSTRADVRSEVWYPAEGLSGSAVDEFQQRHGAVHRSCRRTVRPRRRQAVRKNTQAQSRSSRRDESGRRRRNICPQPLGTATSSSKDAVPQEHTVKDLKLVKLRTSSPKTRNRISLANGVMKDAALRSERFVVSQECLLNWWCFV